MSATELRAGRARPALEGGQAVRAERLPYGRQCIEQRDKQALLEALEGDWLTCGPTVERFERAFAEHVGAAEAVAVSSGTAALHTSMHALGVGPTDEVLVPALTFVASANCVLYQGARPVFVDVDADTLLIDPLQAERKAGPRSTALIAVDYAGQPCDYEALGQICAGRLRLVADACHALGARQAGRASGTMAELNAFSFHPVKHLTTGEGGMVTTQDQDLARRMRVFRNHGLDSDARTREARGASHYEMVELGFNYRLTDLQCALGLAQLERQQAWLERRCALAQVYLAGLADFELARPLGLRPGVDHAWHLFVVELELERLTVERQRVFEALRAEGIGVQVHYPALHLHPYYRQRLGTRPGDCPVAERASQRILSLPMFPGMHAADAADVLEALTKVLTWYRR